MTTKLKRRAQPPPLKVHAIVQVSWLTRGRIQNGHETACGRDDTFLDVTQRVSEITCGTCLSWAIKRTEKYP